MIFHLDYTKDIWCLNDGRISKLASLSMILPVSPKCNENEIHF